MEGIASLCDKLELDPSTDRRCLMLLWKLGAHSKPGQISQNEFTLGMTKLEIDTIEGLKDLIPSLDTGFLMADEFKSFYKFSFLFSREGTHRTIEKDLTIALWQMILADRGNPHVSNFCKFLEENVEENARITLDQWVSFLDFSTCVSRDCKDYEDDDNCAWPVLFDEYVAWTVAQDKMNMDKMDIGGRK